MSQVLDPLCKGSAQAGVGRRAETILSMYSLLSQKRGDCPGLMCPQVPIKKQLLGFESVK